MLFYRYARWDGSQQVFEPDADRLLEELSPGLLEHGDLLRALRDLYLRGLSGPLGQRIEGLRDILERLRARRQDYLQRYHLDSLLEEVQRRLRDILETERRGIDRRVEEARRKAREAGDPTTQRLLQNLEERARKSKEFLDSLPPSVAGAVQALSSYEFMDPEAARQFQDLLALLQGQVAEGIYRGLRQALQGLTPGQLTDLRRMLRALNRLLQERLEGREPDFQGFLQRFGHLFGPDPPRSLDDLLERMARQMAAFQSLLQSLSPSQREELERLVDTLLDPATRRELARLMGLLSHFLPLEDLIRPYPFSGEEPLALEEALTVLGRLHSLEQLEQRLREAIQRGDMEGLDLEALEDLLGPEARRSLEALQRITRALEEAGYVQRKGRRLELTPQGVRRIGQKALREVFLHLKKDRSGGHGVDRAGMAGEPSGSTRPFQWGDPFDLDLGRTLLNSLSREGPGTPLRLSPADLEVREKEEMTQVATCLLLDQSRSMGLFGNFGAAKKVALALSALIRYHFPRDVLYIIGFSDYAIPLKEEDLPGVTWNAWVSGTNMHHALLLARSLLARHKGATRQVLLITDGEPTAHLEGTRSVFSYPPSYRTIQKTLREVQECTRAGIRINTFMLESNYYLLDFVDKLTRLNRGRAFFTTPDRLGKYLLVDYVQNRRKRLIV